MSTLSLKRIASRRDRERFIRLPWSMYADDPHWVPPLLSPLRDRLNSRRNPYFEHADVACFLADRGGEPVGRISAQVCQLAQQFHGRGTGHFGFFECEDSQATADVLFAAAQDWLKRRRMTRMSAVRPLDQRRGWVIGGRL